MEHQVSALVTLATQHNPRDYRIPNPYLGNRACSDEPGRLDVPDCTVSRTTYDFEPFIVSATNYAEHRASYHTSMLRFTHGNWNQPVKVYLRTNSDVSIGQDSLLRYAFTNRKTGSVPVEFVDPADLGLPPIPPPPETPNFEVESDGGTSESLEAGLDLGTSTAPETPQAKYAAMITWIRADRIADHANNSKHVQWKRVLKALGDPGYADYPQSAMTSAQAQARYENSPWLASWLTRGWDSSWDSIWTAIAYAENYTPPPPPVSSDQQQQPTTGDGQLTPGPQPDSPPIPQPDPQPVPEPEIKPEIVKPEIKVAAGNADTLTVAAEVRQASDAAGRPGVPLRFSVSASDIAGQDVTVSYTFASRGVSPYFDYCLAPAGRDPVGFRCASLPYDSSQPTGTVTIAQGASTAEVAVVIDPNAWVRGNAQIDLILTAVTGATAITASTATGNVRR